MKQSTFHTSKENIFDAVIQTANTLDLEVRTKSLADGFLQLEHTGSLLSFGNKIDVKIKSVDGNRHTVLVSSYSSATIQVVDWGTNDKLESDIIRELQTVLNR